MLIQHSLDLVRVTLDIHAVGGDVRDRKQRHEVVDDCAFVLLPPLSPASPAGFVWAATEAATNPKRAVSLIGRSPQPSSIAAGHGAPMRDGTDELSLLTHNFVLRK